jgi:hypothetical protein
VAGDQCGVDVDHQSRLGPATADDGRQLPAGLAAEQPRPLSGRRPGLLQRRQHVGVDRVEHPPTRRWRRDQPEQAGLVPQHGQVSDRLPSVGDHHCHLSQHLTRQVRRTTDSPGPGNLIERSHQTGPLCDIGQ